MDGHKHSHPSEPPSSTQGSRGGWFRAPDCVPIQIERGEGGGHRGETDEWPSLSCQSRRRPRRNPGMLLVQEEKRVVAYGLHLGVSFYPLPCTGGFQSNALDGWMDWKSWRSICGFLPSSSIEAFFYRGYWP